MQFAKLLGIGAIALSVSGIALAQTSTPAPTAPSTNRSDPANPSTTSPSGGRSAPADRSGSTGSTMTSGSGAGSAPALPLAFSKMSANDLVGKSVYNAAGERIGEKKAAIPVSSLSMQGDRIVASSLTKEQVQSMANYKDSDYDKYDRNKTLGEAR